MVRYYLLYPLLDGRSTRRRDFNNTHHTLLNHGPISLGDARPGADVAGYHQLCQRFRRPFVCDSVQIPSINNRRAADYHPVGKPARQDWSLE